MKRGEMWLNWGDLGINWGKLCEYGLIGLNLVEVG